MKKRKLHHIKKGPPGSVIKLCDLNTTLGCREFLKDIIYDGKPITHCWDGDRRIAFEDLDDNEVKDVAAQLYQDFFVNNPDVQPPPFKFFGASKK